MTIMQRMDVAAPEGSIGPRVIPETPDGFPINNLSALYLFKETSNASGFKDEVSGSYASFTGAVASKPGGGVELSGMAASILTRPSFDIRARWTIMIGMTQLAPPTAGAGGRRAIMRLGDFGNRGLMAWI